MWTRQLEWIEPFEAARRLAALPRLAFLDSAMGHGSLGRYSYVAADPFEVCSLDAGSGADGEPAGFALAGLRRRLARFALARDPGLPPFQGGAIGNVAYEVGWALENRPAPTARRAADSEFGFYDVIVAFDRRDHRCWLIASGFPETSATARGARAARRLAEFSERLRQAAPEAALAPALDWRPTTSRDAYCASVERVKAAILAGDIYQANISQRFVATLPPTFDALAAYGALRAANPAPFGAYLSQGGRTILSTSPELFLRCDGRTVETRPIKGTARRDADPDRDRAQARTLAASRKDRAENIMIVDLLRNDLSKVCTPNSVGVPTLCEVESYAGLHHLVSRVVGELDPDRDALDLLAAAFPGGSITGAPKLRAMEIIAEIEGRARGVYCGALGAIGFDGSMDLNIAIRTVVVEDGAAELRVGGGITMLSDAAAEYEETLVKGRRIFAAFAPAPITEDA